MVAIGTNVKIISGTYAGQIGKVVYQINKYMYTIEIAPMVYVSQMYASESNKSFEILN